MKELRKDFKSVFGDNLKKMIDFSEKNQREIAKEILKQNNLEWCQVQLSYAIGVKKPLAIYIESDKGCYFVKEDSKYYEECKPQNIIKDLNLKNICYEKLAQFGHFVN